MVQPNKLTNSSRWVVKVGTSLLIDPQSGLNKLAIDSLVAQMAKLQQQGMQILLVSSGAIVEGMRRMGWQQRPTEINHLQAAAAIGQMGLMQCYQSAFQKFDIVTAQVLLTHADLANRERYLNVRNTLRTLLSLKVLPIINENDAVVNDEIRFGDNDTLAALVANLVEAEALVILTDCKGLYNCDPKQHGDAVLIEQRSADDPSLLRNFKNSVPGAFGRGGMLTKIQAAQKAARAGAVTVIADGRDSDTLLRMRSGQAVGTLLSPGTERLAARKQWLAGQLRGTGKLVLDEGAVQVLQKSGRSLLPIGVTEVKGVFKRGDIITCVDLQGQEVAHGLVNYSSEEATRIVGKPSHQIEAILGYGGDSEIIHRDNIALLR